ncbi:MAG: metal ABC transporter permease [Lachnospiraceae bacterium]|jgi:zinc transport system permease protein|nr:metal ABC transporter permease [Lachnospiraceae bacterium]
MSEVFSQISFYLEFPFVRYALIVGVLIALCSSLLGVTLVLRRYSFIGTGLSNVAFGSTAIAAALTLTNNIILVLPVTVACALFLLRTGASVKVKGDAALAMIAAGSMAIGYLVMNVYSTSANLAGDVCTILFGATSILTLTMTNVRVSIALSVIVVAIFLFFYHKIFAVTFDEDFAAATGVRAKSYNMLLAVVTAVVIVLAMDLVGALLISALVIFPPMAAMSVFRSFRAVMICAVTVSVICAALGILVSIVAGTPVGSTIVAVNIGSFILFSLTGLVVRRLR